MCFVKRIKDTIYTIPISFLYWRNSKVGGWKKTKTVEMDGREENDRKRRKIDDVYVKPEPGSNNSSTASGSESSNRISNMHGLSAASGGGAGNYAEAFMAEQMKKMSEKMAKMERELAAAKSKANEKKTSSTGEHEPQNFELTSDGKRKVQVRTYRGAVQVDVREWYEKDGVLRPGKRGLSLKVDQWKRLVQWIPKIQEAIDSMS